MAADITTALVRKCNELMIRSRTKFVEQYTDTNATVHWHEVKHILTDNVVAAHFSGDRTIGVFYANGGSTFLIFDVDALDDPNGQFVRVNAIVTALQSVGVHTNDIHVMFSGYKGYHIQLFFDGFLPVRSLAAFGRNIIGSLGDYSTGIELRPESVTGRGVKLPLAYHQASGMFAHYVDKFTLKPVEDSVEYFLDIQPMMKAQMEGAITAAIDQDKRVPRGLSYAGLVEQNTSDSFAERPLPNGEGSDGFRTTVQQLLDNGLVEKGTRNKVQFEIALLLKEQGVPLDDAIPQLTQWVHVQYNRGMTKERNLRTLYSEAERCVTTVYGDERYVGLSSNRGRKPVMTGDDALWTARFRKDHERRVIWALLIIGRMYHEEGRFFASMTHIEQLTGLARQTVGRILKKLSADGELEVIQDWSYTQNQARSYRMPRLTKKNSSDISIPLAGATVGHAYRSSLLHIECLHDDLYSVSDL